ncbi:hypothetical protein KFK09_008553 [Dendrobium nobile]|uniref:Uncharacterized protein n=1 Tax=Dendrobium nobile TaxID=94219 RepID=A0A8T3BNE5_DENNO|nr:hypothetical protein KFK09_008553 [Dendrobium nobile]
MKPNGFQWEPPSFFFQLHSQALASSPNLILSCSVNPLTRAPQIPIQLQKATSDSSHKARSVFTKSRSRHPLSAIILPDSRFGLQNLRSPQ